MAMPLFNAVFNTSSNGRLRLVTVQLLCSEFVPHSFHVSSVTFTLVEAGSSASAFAFECKHKTVMILVLRTSLVANTVNSPTRFFSAQGSSCAQHSWVVPAHPGSYNAVHLETFGQRMPPTFSTSSSLAVSMPFIVSLAPSTWNDFPSTGPL